MQRQPHDVTLEQALALGGDRVATLAHPHCTCSTVSRCTSHKHSALLISDQVACKQCRSTCPMHA